MQTDAYGANIMYVKLFASLYASGLVESITIEGIAPPEIPTLECPGVIRAKQFAVFKGYCVDQNDDPVRYIIDWGDGTSITKTEFFDSGEEALIEHTYKEIGNYTITVKSEDCDKLESEGSSTYNVSVTGGKNDNYVQSSATSTQQAVPSSQQQDSQQSSQNNQLSFLDGTFFKFLNS
jgi:hypothetical protein